MDSTARDGRRGHGPRLEPERGDGALPIQSLFADQPAGARPTRAAQASRKPCVLVTASEGADAVAGKSGCSFAALPAHFGLDTVEVRLIRPPLSLDGSAG